MAGGGAVEKMNGRARWIKYSIASPDPATNAPLTPMAFPAVLIDTKTSPAKPLPRSP